MAADVFLLGDEFRRAASGLLLPESVLGDEGMPADIAVIGTNITEALRPRVGAFDGSIEPGEGAVAVPYPVFLAAAMDIVRFERARRASAARREPQQIVHFGPERS